MLAPLSIDTPVEEALPARQSRGTIAVSTGKVRYTMMRARGMRSQVIIDFEDIHPEPKCDKYNVLKFFLPQKDELRMIIRGVPSNDPITDQLYAHDFAPLGVPAAFMATVNYSNF